MLQIPLFKIRASKASVILSKPKGKTNIEKYTEATDLLISKKKYYDGLKDKTGVNGQKWAKVIHKLENVIIPNLSKLKDKVELSETCKQYLSEWIIEKKYGRSKEFTSKQTEKGEKTQKDGLQLIQEVVFNNETFLSDDALTFEDEYKTGETDAIVLWQGLKIVVDNKSSFTLWTFPFTETEATNPLYIAQKKVYIDLAKADAGKLCYTLNDTPYHIVEKELEYYRRNNDLLEISDIPEAEAYDIIKNHVYTKEGLNMYRHILGTYNTSDFIEIPKEKRVKAFDIEKDDEFIQKLHKRVIECREWIADNWDKF